MQMGKGQFSLLKLTASCRLWAVTNEVLVASPLPSRLDFSTAADVCIATGFCVLELMNLAD